jgi:hypothetical protein
MSNATTIRHVRKSGHNPDRRFRWGSYGRKTVSHGGTFCGEPETPDDLSRDNALASVRLAAIYKALGQETRVIDDAAEMCPACLAAIGTAETK